MKLIADHEDCRMEQIKHTASLALRCPAAALHELDDLTDCICEGDGLPDPDCMHGWREDVDLLRNIIAGLKGDLAAKDAAIAAMRDDAIAIGRAGLDSRIDLIADVEEYQRNLSAESAARLAAEAHAEALSNALSECLRRKTWGSNDDEVVARIKELLANRDEPRAAIGMIPVAGAVVHWPSKL